MEENQSLKDILDTYRMVVKPLLVTIETRNNGIPVNCLNEIRALNDHIARCYRPGMKEVDKHKELSKAEGHVRRLIFDCFKQLNISLYEKIECYETKYYSTRWQLIEGGQFWRKYVECKRNALEASVEAKKLETYQPEESMKKYECSYLNYCEIEELFLSHKKDMFLSRVLGWYQNVNSWIIWAFLTVMSAILSTLICEYIA